MWPGIGLLIAIAYSGVAAAQDYPLKSIRFVIPQPPGGATDGLARTLSQKMSDAWGQQVVVDNRGGGAGNIAAEIVARAPADGYTLIMVGLWHAANLGLFPKLTYHPLRDFTPITQVVAIDTFLVVHQSVPVKSVKELIALARAQPGALFYASGGNGSSPHMAMELFKSMAKVNIVHVPYKGTESVVGMLRGETAMIFENLISVGAHVKAGRLKMLAVGGAKRSHSMPAVPTVAEAGVPGYEISLWFGMLAPAGVPKPVVAKIHREVAGILKLPDVKERLTNLAAEPVGNSPEEFEALIKSEITKWDKVIREAGIKVD
ncbi:MAG: tripartite tricarboxylate transporter substrate binding protein [Betaproteobacteria bacterium]|nr:tripartite tricarboxylate transporter substrate binding protein [Betaproteobacteria bacterium]